MIKFQTARVLQRLLRGERVWDYGADFNELWRIESLKPSHMIVVWADTPADPNVHPVATARYLTPIDWAIAACCQIADLTVSVLDLRPTQHKDTNEYPVLHWLKTQRPECVPWLRYLTVQDLLNAPDADSLEMILAPGSAAPEGAPKVEPREALRALPVCQIDLTGDEGHHAISNIVGPLLLLRNYPVRDHTEGANHREALRQLLTAAEFAPKPIVPIAEFAIGEDELINLVAFDHIRIVLIDDQWHHGWAAWLSERLGLKWDGCRADAARQAAMKAPQCIVGAPDSGISLWVAGAPQWILHRARTALEGKKKDARFKLRLTDDGGTCPEILLLDLRLFTPLSPDERLFTQDVANLARRFVDTAREGPYFDGSELDSVGHDVAGRATMLTLLPRVLAQTDFSLPIILFSSTSRREIVVKFHGYNNIFTDFSKPRPFGEASLDVAERAEKTFAAALRQALQLAAARQLCGNIIIAADNCNAVDRRAPSDISHFELYLDESGGSAISADPDVIEAEKKRFVIGGLLIGYWGTQENGGPRDLHHTMGEKGLRWWPEHHGGHYLKKRNVASKADKPGGASCKPEDILATFLGCLGKAPAYGVCLEYRGDIERGDVERDELRALWRSDNRYRFMLSTLLELLLFDVLPTIVNDNATISIFVATRARQASEFAGGEAKVKRIRELYGYEGNYSHFQSMSAASVLPVILEATERRGESILPAKLEHARGVTLTYVDRPRWELTQHQHYVADIVANSCFTTGQKFLPNSNIAKIFERGIYDKSDARLNSLLRAARALSADDRSGAILEVANIDFGLLFAKRSTATLLLQRLAGELRENLRSEDLLLVARGIEPRELLQPHPASSQVQHGTVISIKPDDGYGYIRPKVGDENVYFRIGAWQSATFPSLHERVDFESFRGPDGKLRASWVRSLV